MAPRHQTDAGLLPESASRARETFSRSTTAFRSRILPETFKKALYYGTGDEPIQMSSGGNGKSPKTARPFEGLVPQMERLYEETESEFTRNRIRAFMTRVPARPATARA